MPIDHFKISRQLSLLLPDSHYHIADREILNLYLNLIIIFLQMQKCGLCIQKQE